MLMISGALALASLALVVLAARQLRRVDENVSTLGRQARRRFVQAAEQARYDESRRTVVRASTSARSAVEVVTVVAHAGHNAIAAAALRRSGSPRPTPRDRDPS